VIEARFGRLFARSDAAACFSAKAATHPIREGTVALGLETIGPSLLARRKN
jgi:hypothetical protein